VLTGAARDRRALAENLLKDPRIVQASYYFRFYVDEAMYAAGIADGYLARLEPWRAMIRDGLSTTPETPDPSRSDSHAWSAHPNYHLLATVLGVRPGSPGFRTVVIAPALGALKWAEGRVPHPAGEISARLRRVGAAGIKGTISLPPNVSGTFIWSGHTVSLQPGQNIVQQ
jgi:alpha-L-rhamnosidase